MIMPIGIVSVAAGSTATKVCATSEKAFKRLLLQFFT